MTNTLLDELNLFKFIAFDLETTGLDPSLDSVIEFAAVLFEDGKAKSSLTFLCEPESVIPQDITYITGITDEMVKGKANFKERLSEVIDFFSDVPLVGHNIGFDLSFLKSYLRQNARLNKIRINNRLYDTSLLSQAFFFYLNDHTLSTVAEYCGCSSRGAHRAEKDALNTGNIFIKLVERASLYDLETLQTINMILEGTNDPNKWLYINLAERLISKRSLGLNKSPHIDWESKPNIVGDDVKNSRDNASTCEVPASEIEKFFTENGIVAQKLPNFEPRPQQKEMASVILSCLNEGKSAIIEAGTGVGKSLAYLIPLILWLNISKGKKHRATITCNTINLQEQIFYKEVPFASKQLELPFRAVLLKGRNNYICLTRWYNFLSDLPNKLNISDRSSIIPIVIWLKHTVTGDISECSGFKLSRNQFIWREICSEPGYCTTDICEKYHGCYLGKIRWEANASDIMIINHSLLLADSVTDKKVLPEYDVLIIDEAHNLEKNAYNYYASKINLPTVSYLLKATYTGGKPERGLLVDVYQFCQKIKKAKEIEQYVEKIKDIIDNLFITSGAFFKRIATSKIPQGNEKKYGIKKRYKVFKEEFPNLMEDVSTFIYELELFETELIKLKQKVEDLVVDFPQVFDEVRTKLTNIIEQVAAYRMTLEVASRSENDELIFWYEIGANSKENSVELGFTPLDVSKLLYEKLFQDLHSIVLTSATLQVASSFDYLLHRTGMIYLGDEKVIKTAVGSPFKYQDQSAFYTYHAEQFKKNTMESVASLIIRLAEEINRGMMVLFTSYSSLKEIYRAVSPYLKKIGTTLLAQGYGASRTNLLNQFRKEKKSVLFGTDSFWEGIDIIGDALEVLIINKLPFPVPSEPIIEANIENISKKGKDPFLEYYVPEAVIKFRQGFGRLIRSSTDIGIVINLDDRIDKKRYGITFKESLPVEAISICGEEEMINVVNRFFKYNSVIKK